MMIQDHFEEGSYNHFQDKDITITLMILEGIRYASQTLRERPSCLIIISTKERLLYSKDTSSFW